MTNSQNKLIAIVGETASGKSGIAVQAARRHNGEVICADSRTIYKGMDIGTAKPTKEEMQGIPHHGLDLVNPDENYSAAQFKDYAQATIIDIQKRGKIPILVGGTGLYIDGVLFNYSFGGDKNEKLRGELNNKSVAELSTLAKNMKIEVSEQTLKNKRHLIRLIERNGQTEQTNKLFYNALITGVQLSKTQLRKRIEQRVEVMFRAGLRNEYNELRAHYALNSEAFTGIGYQEFAEWERGNTSMSEVKRQIVKNTMQLAKRQRTWFKRNRFIQWAESSDDALVLIDRFMDNDEYEVTN